MPAELGTTLIRAQAPSTRCSASPALDAIAVGIPASNGNRVNNRCEFTHSLSLFLSLEEVAPFLGRDLRR